MIHHQQMTRMTPEAFEQWCRALALPLESHKVELWVIFVMDHDPEVLEFFDQPDTFKLCYPGTRSGKGWDGGTVGMNAVLFACVAFFATCLGSIFALHSRDHLSLLLGFTAGTLIGLAVFQWLPRLFDALSVQPRERLPALLAVMVGFLFYHVLDKLSGLLHHHSPHMTVQGDPLLGAISVLLFALHRVFEGISIGASFQVNTTTGVLVGIAVILHDLVEGWNAVAVLLVNHNSRRQALGLLLLFASAPVLGALITFWIALPVSLLPRYLGFFVGLFLCIGASHLLPEAHRERGSLFTILCTIAGMILAFVITSLPMILLL